MRDLSSVKRMVVKIGTATLSRNGGIDTSYVRSVARQIAQLHRQERQVLLVTSGAIGMGAGALKLKGPITELPLRQACAAVGQPLLMHEYHKAFQEEGLSVSQVLLTAEVLSKRKSYLNLRNAIETLLSLGVVPILNENDSVSTEEIGTAFGDNDRLSALVASKIDADLLILLTDIDALYDKNPREFPDAKPIRLVEEITEDIRRAAGKKGSAYSTGGMKTKIEAVRIAFTAGCRVILAHGREQEVLCRILDGEEIGTLFLPKSAKLPNRKRWILHSRPEGTIYVDAGAMAALRQNKSLLPKGITGIEGTFSAGAVVMINQQAKAVTSLNSAELRQVAGKHSSQIRQILGPNHRDVAVVPEDIVFLDEPNNPSA
ncbi:MAG: glutamate 5-kinase [Anaerohalosphaeraceae bacterium]